MQLSEAELIEIRERYRKLERLYDHVDADLAVREKDLGREYRNSGRDDIRIRLERLENLRGDIDWAFEACREDLERLLQLQRVPVMVVQRAVAFPNTDGKGPIDMGPHRNGSSRH